MKLEDIRIIARLRSINSDHLSISALIKAIQTREGNFDCFATAAGGECDQPDCLWGEDCFAAAYHS